MNRDFLVVLQHYDRFLAGLGNTLWLASATLVMASIIGCVIAAMMLSPVKPVRIVVSLVVDGMRTVPFLLLAYLVYYGLPRFGIEFGSWSSGLSALVIYHTAYIAEIVRNSWMNLSHDQIEAGRAHGFAGFRLFRRIILPQLFFASAPVIGNQAVQILKDTAFLMIITVPELTFAASSVQATYFVPFASFIAAMLLYWIVTLAIETAIRAVEAAAEVRRAN
ncbi:amino acid ABC transporter permease [Trinickia mobilis]|uniref:amino acid ABC transporter permease n=1 Tax=Trinickia mobilis TaxID=2816356 RepID=UPI001A8F86FD|nr:amino acid ABC transporter permease [Trinickia mobilis]